METICRIAQDELVDFVARLFSRFGLTLEDARLLALSLVDADMCGVKSHGLVRVPSYVDQLRNGAFGTDSELEVVRDSGFALLLDAHNAMGAVASQKACRMTREKAEKFGIACTLVRGSNHYGAAGYWADILAQKDMIGFSATNTVPIVTPPGGIGRGIGSNPFAYSIPAGKYPSICLDIAVGVMAQGKIWEYKRLDKKLPENAWIGPDGEITTDPHKFDVTDYIMMPFGAHKGFGLGIIMELITSQLAGDRFHSSYAGLTADMPKTSHIFVAMRIDAFLDPEEYRARVDDYIDYVHGLPVRPGCPAPKYPGEIEAGIKAEAIKNGVPLAKQVLDDMVAIAREVDVDTTGLPCI